MASTAQPCRGLQLIFPKAGVALSSSIREQPFKLLPGVLHKSSPGSSETASNYTEVLRKQVRAQRKVKRRGGVGEKKKRNNKNPSPGSSLEWEGGHIRQGCVTRVEIAASWPIPSRARGNVTHLPTVVRFGEDLGHHLCPETGEIVVSRAQRWFLESKLLKASSVKDIPLCTDLPVSSTQACGCAGELWEGLFTPSHLVLQQEMATANI